MLERLNDKVSGVRLQAARVLQRLARPDEVQCSDSTNALDPANEIMIHAKNAVHGQVHDK